MLRLFTPSGDLEMLRKLILSLICVLLTTATGQAALVYSWVRTATGQTTNPLAYPGQFDTWEFQLLSIDGSPAFGGAAKNYDSLSLNFTSASGAFLTTGNTTFKSGSANPVLFGITAPDCFFVLPAGATPLAATQTDTASVLQSSFTTQGGLILVPANGGWTTVAAFSVPTGTTFSAAGIFFAGGAAGQDPIGFPPIWPEPSTLVLFGLGVGMCCGFSRRR